MKYKTITLNALPVGSNVGPNFWLTASVGLVSPTGATLSELLVGKPVVIDDLATSITITSLGVCNTGLTLNIPAGTTTTTTPAPGTTTTTTPAPGTTTTTTPAPGTTTTTTPAPGTTTTTTPAPTTTTTTTTPEPTTTTTTTLDCNWSANLSLTWVTTPPRTIKVSYDGLFPNQGAMGNITISGQESLSTYATGLTIYDLAAGYDATPISTIDENLVITSNSICTNSVYKATPIPFPTYDYITETYTCTGSICDSPKSGDSGISNAYPGLTIGSFYLDKFGTIHKLISATTGGGYIITYFTAGSGSSCNSLCIA